MSNELFITVGGVTASGKSSVMEIIATALEQHGIDVVVRPQGVEKRKRPEAVPAVMEQLAMQQTTVYITEQPLQRIG